MAIRFFEHSENGVTYRNFDSDMVIDAVTTIGTDRIVIPGRFSIALMKGRDEGKFPPQLQIKVFVKKGGSIREYRNESDYDRAEICIPLEEGIALIRCLNAELILRGLLLEDKVLGQDEPQVRD